MTSIETGTRRSVYKIQARTADNRTVMVTLRPHQTQTRVAAGSALFGDEPLSRALLERTGVRLGTLPAAAIPDKSPARLAQIHSSRATPCPTRRCSRMSPKHRIAIASFLDARLSISALADLFSPGGTASVPVPRNRSTHSRMTATSEAPELRRRPATAGLFSLANRGPRRF